MSENPMNWSFKKTRWRIVFLPILTVVLFYVLLVPVALFVIFMSMVFGGQGISAPPSAWEKLAGDLLLLLLMVLAWLLSWRLLKLGKR